MNFAVADNANLSGSRRVVRPRVYVIDLLMRWCPTYLLGLSFARGSRSHSQSATPARVATLGRA